MLLFGERAFVLNFFSIKSKWLRSDEAALMFVLSLLVAPLLLLRFPSS